MCIKKSIIGLSFLVGIVASQGAAIDLSSWSPLTLDFSGGQAGANWSLQPGNTAVVQTVNADPSFYMNNINQTSYSMDGTWRVNTGGDDDYMGFVFGFQNSANFYLFDWKQGTQGYQGATAAEGMTIKKFVSSGSDGLQELSLGELWHNTGNMGEMTVLASNHGSSAGWAAHTLYNFHLDFNIDPGKIRVIVKQGDTTLWDTTVSDATFTGGEFGFYNYSQSQVEYAGFEQTGGVPVDAPEGGATALLLGLGTALLLRFKRNSGGS